MINKIINSIKEKRFIRTCWVFLLKKLLPVQYRIVYNMSNLPDGKKLEIDNYDFVRLAILKLLSYEIYSDDKKGNVAELGVYQGGFARYINEYFPDRKLYLFDTFEGFCDKDIALEKNNGYSDANQDFTDTSAEMVLNKMPFPSQCIVRKGYFPETSIGLENESFIFVSLDADLFEPMYNGLLFFYPRLYTLGI